MMRSSTLRRAVYIVLVVLGSLTLYAVIKQFPSLLTRRQSEVPGVISSRGASDSQPTSQATNCEKYGPYASEEDVRKYQDVYYQRHLGYPKELTLTEAVSEFNAMANCHPIGKSSPPLKVEELLAAVRSVKLKDRSIKPWLSQRYKRISEDEILPLGSYIDYGGGARNFDGYDISEWSIYLSVGLDKYPGDIIGNPIFSTLVRKQYISSRRAQ